MLNKVRLEYRYDFCGDRTVKTSGKEAEQWPLDHENGNVAFM